MRRTIIMLFIALSATAASAQTSLTDSVNQWTAAQAAAYYQAHEDHRAELRPLIMRRFMARQDTMSYLQLRSLRRTFWYTDMQDSVNQMYLQRRSEVLPMVQAAVDSLCRAELDSIDTLRVSVCESLTPMIGRSVETSLKGLMGGFMPDGSDDVSRLYQSHCKAAISVKDIKAAVGPVISRCIARLNLARKTYINKVAGYNAASGGYKIAPFSYVIGRSEVSCPIDDLMQFVALQGQIDWLHIGVTPAGFVPEGVGESLLSGRPLVSDDVANRNKDTRRLAPIANSIASKTAEAIRQSVYKTIDAVFATVARKVGDSQQAFKTVVEAKY